MSKQFTEVSTASVDDLNDIFSGALSDGVLLPEEPTTEPTVVNRAPETDFDPQSREQKPEEAEEPTVEVPSVEVEDTLSSALSEPDEPDTVEEQEPQPLSGIASFLKKQIEANKMFAFDDFDPEKQELDAYLSSLSEEDLEQLYEANENHKAEQLAEQIPQQFFDNLPEQFKYAYQYIANGGEDLKGLFKALADTETVKTLNPESEPAKIVEQYLKATKWGDDDEIQEQISEWKDLEKLTQKAESFKPKLEKMQQQIVEQKLAQQEDMRIQRQQAAQKYAQSVESSLNVKELGGIKLDKKTQTKLYQGLISPSYQTSDGNPTNLLGHLLDKYQKENIPLLAEALWLLEDPDGYKAKIKEMGKGEAVADTVRKLKIEQTNKSALGTTSTHKAKTLSRPGSMFKRF